MKYDHCYSCGPMPMMKALSAICRNNEKPLLVSLEETMACGIGACGGCMVDIKENDKAVTKRGRRLGLLR